MDTAIRLRLRDGAVFIGFQPNLTPEQYAEFYAITKIATTKDNLRTALKSAAKRWGVEVDVSDSD
jgi:hypothetical protein